MGLSLLENLTTIEGSEIIFLDVLYFSGTPATLYDVSNPD